VLGARCAGRSAAPSPDVADAARVLTSYSANLAVKMGGRKHAPRSTVMVGFRRPDRLRIEMPGPGGARLILVARNDVVTAVFPKSRAVFEGKADRQVLGDITGVALAPTDVMDFLVGVQPPSVTEYSASWGPVLPKQVKGKLEDGTHLDVKVNEPSPGATLAERAFEPPPHERYRRIDAAEARELWQK
jgi:hypothetical protein